MSEMKKSMKRSSIKLSQQNISMRPVNNFFSSTQSLFPTKTPIIGSNTSSPHTMSQLYQTIGSPGASFPWRRPESKHGCRRMNNRPETSKGIRNGRSAKYSSGVHSSANFINPGKFSELSNKENLANRNELPSKSMYQHEGKHS